MSNGDRGTRHYCLTDFVMDETFLQSLPYSYLCYGKETCPDTGRPHLQTYVYLKNAKTFSAMKKLLGTRHFELCGGSAEQNRDYCRGNMTTKAGVYKPLNLEFFEFGEIPKQGKRSDIQLVRKNIQNGSCTMRDILTSATSFQSIRMAEIHFKYFEEPRRFKPEVFWFYGASGSGKTREAYDICEKSETVDFYVCMESNKWWEGYDAHADIIIDDYRPEFSSFKTFIKLLDRYECRIECKGGSRQLKASRIFITTPLSPSDTWKYHTNEDLYQLTRRITEIKHFVRGESPRRTHCIIK